MVTARELQRSQRNRSRTFTSGKLSPRWARSFTSESRAECLHLRQYAPQQGIQLAGGWTLSPQRSGRVTHSGKITECRCF
jgi:hypothetical protein